MADRKLSRVALRSGLRYVTVDEDGDCGAILKSEYDPAGTCPVNTHG